MSVKSARGDDRDDVDESDDEYDEFESTLGITIFILKIKINTCS